MQQEPSPYFTQLLAINRWLHQIKQLWFSFLVDFFDNEFLTSGNCKNMASQFQQSHITIIIIIIMGRH